MSSTRMGRIVLAWAAAATTAVVVGPSLTSTPSVSAGSDAQTPIVVTGACSLSEAVAAANTGATSGGCANPSASTYIVIAADPLIDGRPAIGTLVSTADGPDVGGAPTALPTIGTDIVIEGEGGAGIFFGNAFDRAPRLAHVAPQGRLTLRTTTVSGFAPTGTTSTAAAAAGDVSGGAIYAEGPLTLDRVVMSNNAATGGASGFPAISSAGKSGGSARGGAVFASAALTVTDSVFVDNAVRGGQGVDGDSGSGRSGGDGGDALGADIFVAGLDTTVTIDGAMFTGSLAEGGNGGVGHTSDEARSLTRPQRPPDGRDGFCDSTPTRREADGQNGKAPGGSRGVDLNPFSAAEPGGAGGDGGDATGAIHVEGDVEMHAVTLDRPVARAGSAGGAGLPQLGGAGSNGGDGVVCDTRDAGFAIFDDSPTLEGFGGNGGDAGAHGDAFPQGGRGSAIAAVSAERVDMINTTVYSPEAAVPDDVVEEFVDREVLLERLSTANTRVGRGGRDGDGGRGFDGSPALASRQVQLDALAAPGVVAIVQGKAQISFSTFFGANLRAPGDNGGRTTATAATPFAVAGSGGTVDHSILHQLPIPRPFFACNGFESRGYNVITEGAGCPFEPPFERTPTDVDVPANGSPTGFFLNAGRLLTVDAFGDEQHMRTLPPRPDGAAVDLGPVGESCTTSTGTPVIDDARGLRRSGPCDSGAREFRITAQQVTVLPPFPPPATQYIVDGFGQPTGPEMRIPLFFDFVDGTGESDPARLTLRFSDPTLQVVSVDRLPPGVTAEVSGSNDVTIEVPAVADPSTFGRSVDVFVLPTPGVDVLTVDAAIRGPGEVEQGAQLTDSTTFDIVYDPAFEVRHDGVDETVSRCEAAYPLVFDVEATGLSRLPAGFHLDVRPSGSAEVIDGTGSVAAQGDVVRWTPGTVRTKNVTERIQVLVDASTLSVGGTFQPSYTFVPPSLDGSTIEQTVLLPGVRTVLPAADLSVEVLGLDDLRKDDTRTVTVRITNDAPSGCGDATGVRFGATGFTNFANAPADVDQVLGTIPGGARRDVTFEITAPPTGELVSFDWTLDFTGDDLVGGPLTGEVTAAVDATVLVTAAVAGDQPDPTNEAVIDFDVVFDEPVEGFGPEDVELFGRSRANTVDVTDTGSGATYQVRVSGMTSDGLVGMKVRSGAATAVSGNGPSERSNDAAVYFDLAGPIATVDWLDGPAVTQLPVRFAIDLYEGPQSDVELDDVTVGGSANPTEWTIAPGSGPGERTSILTVTATERTGTIEVNVREGAVVDVFGNPSTVDDQFTQNFVDYYSVPGVATDVEAAAPDAGVEVSWTPPTDTGGLPLTRYDVEVLRFPLDGSDPFWDGAVTALNPADLDPIRPTVTVPAGELTPGEPVAFRVRSYNLVGDSQSASVQSATVTPNPRPTVTLAPAVGQDDPATGGPIELVAAFDTPVTGFGADDVTLGGTAEPDSVVVTPLGGDDYLLTVTGMMRQGTVTAQVVDAAAQRESLQTSEASNVLVIGYDATPPTAYVSTAMGQVDPTASTAIAFTVAFDEPVVGFTQDDLTVGGTAGGSITSFVPSTALPNTWDVGVTANAVAGSVVLGLPDGSATDPAGNSSVTVLRSNTVDVVVPPGPPVDVQVSAGDGEASASWSPPADDGGDPIADYLVEVSVDGGSFEPLPDPVLAESLTLDGLTNDVEIRVRVAARNLAGPGVASAPVAARPTPPPSVELSAVPGQDPATSSPVEYVVTFDQPVTGFAADDIAFGGTSEPDEVLVTATADPAVYDVDISGMRRDGIVGMYVEDEAAANANGQPNVASAAVIVDFDAFGPIATVDLGDGQSAETTSTPIVFAVTFDEAVDGFDAADVSIGGSAAPEDVSVEGAGDSYTVTVGSVQRSGTVVLTVAAAAVEDALGNPSTVNVVTDTVAIEDATGPVLAVPADIEVVLPPGASSVVVDFEVSASDPGSDGRLTEASFGGAVAVTCDPPSGSGFGIGVTTVVCSATDSSGNLAAADFTVSVLDAEAPELPEPSGVIEATLAPDGTVTYPEPVASDNSGDVTVTCDPPSGARLSAGDVVVTCTATDSSGNTSTGSYRVSVPGPEPLGGLPITGLQALPLRWMAAVFAAGVLLVLVSRRRRESAGSRG